MNKRVLVIVQNAPIEGDKRVRRELSALTAAGFQASLICPEPESPIEPITLENIDLLRFKKPRSGEGFGSYVREYLVSLNRIFRLTLKEYYRTKFQVLQVCNPPDLFFILGTILRPLGVRFVFDQHDPSPEIYLSRFTKPRRTVYKLMRFFEYLSYRAADIVLVTNESAKTLATTRGHVAPERVYVVRNGPYLSPSNGVHACLDLRSDRHKYVVCCMGWIAPQDGVNHFIDAADYLVKVQRRNDICFLIVGDGSQLNQLKEKVAALHLTAHVVFTGYVNNERQLKGYLHRSDVCVSPEPQSPCNERMTFIKVLDYMAAGKPIVAFDLPETRASAHRAALYARPNDIVDFSEKISLLLDEPQLRRTIGDFGKKRVQECLLWEHSKVNFLNAYSDLFGDRPSKQHEADRSGIRKG